MNRWDSLAGWLYQRQTTPWQRVKQACQSLSHAAEFGAEWSPLGHATFWIRPLLELGAVEFDSKSILACQPGIIFCSVTGLPLASNAYVSSVVCSEKILIAGQLVSQQLARDKNYCEQPKIVQHGSRMTLVSNYYTLYRVSRIGFSRCLRILHRRLAYGRC